VSQIITYREGFWGSIEHICIQIKIQTHLLDLKYRAASNDCFNKSVFVFLIDESDKKTTIHFEPFIQKTFINKLMLTCHASLDG